MKLIMKLLIDRIQVNEFRHVEEATQRLSKSMTDGVRVIVNDYRFQVQWQISRQIKCIAMDALWVDRRD